MSINKKLFRICLLIVVLFVIPSIGITSVSAAYNNNTIYVSTSGNNNNDGSSWNNSKASINNATGSVSNNGKIYLDSGTYYEHNIKISKNTTIIGLGQKNTIITAEGKGNIFNIASGVVLTLKNITLTNGNVVGNGGAIQNSGTCNLIGINFYDNQATGSSAAGGAIANDGGTLTVIDTIFKNNKATHNGGAISNKGQCVIKNSNFNSNSANLGGFWDGYGAAIYNKANCVIEYSNFTENTGFYGGAIYNDANCTLANSNFIDNTGFDGGAIYNGANCTLTKCNFLRNDANYSSLYNGNNYDTGGAVFNEANFQVTSSIFRNNTALNEGGAIYNWYKCTVNFCSIVGNKAKTGNTIYNDKNTGMSMDAINNWWGLSDSPTGIYGASNPTTWLTLSLEVSPSVINPSIFEISANLTQDIQGKYHDPVNGCLPDGIYVSFDSAFGSIPASAVTKNGIATVTFTPSIYSGEATVIVTVDNEKFYIPFTVTNKNIYVSTNGNDTTGDGSPNKPYQTIKNGISMLNTGGCLHIANGVYNGDNNTGITIYNNMSLIGQSPFSTIIDGLNTTQLFNIVNGVNVTIKNLKLINGNSKEFYGGAIHNEGTLTINNCIFSGNTANTIGSALFNYGECNVIGSNFTGNYGFLGGALYNSGNCTVTKTNFTGNHVTNNGGAILNNGDLIVTSSNFINNTALYYGGAIYNISNLTAHFNRIVENIASNGNNIYNTGDADAEYNWWGSNKGPIGSIYEINVNRWLILKINALPNPIKGNTSTISADLRYDNKGTQHNEEYIPDGLMLIFKTTLGTIKSSKTTNGIAISTLNMGIKSGVAVVSTAIDNETVQISVIKDTTSPTVSVKPAAGIYNTNQTIILKMNEAGTVYYTLNGMTPTKTSSKYTKPISISKTLILKYFAVDLAGNKSPIYSKTYIIDKVAPEVKTTTPVNLKTGVSRTSNITIKFSENVKSTEYFNDIIIKNSAGKILHINKRSIKGNTLYITTNKRIANAWYQVIIPKSSIKDYAGNNLKLNYSFKFKTGKY